MPKKEVSKNDKKEKKENKHFFKDFKAELKKSNLANTKATCK